MPVIDPKTFRNALGSFATGVTIVTAHGPDGTDVGVTANSFNSVSLDPPLILWSLSSASASLPAFVESEGFAIPILAEHQQDMSNRFASRVEDRFAGLSLARGFGGAPLLEGCVATFQCRLAYRYNGGDHKILVGEVLDFQSSDLRPLLYHGGRYGAVAAPQMLSVGEDGTRQDRDLIHLISRVYHQLFSAEREEHAKRGLTEEEYLALRLLGSKDELSTDEMAQLAATAGAGITSDVLYDLERAGHIVLTEGNICKLTDGGRQLTMEFAAVRLAKEEMALEPFDRSETQVLKSLLLRISHHCATQIDGADPLGEQPRC